MDNSHGLIGGYDGSRELGTDREWVLGLEDAVNRMIEEIASLRGELEELKAWKQSALKQLNEIDLQAVSKAMNLPLGRDIGPEILPYIVKAKEALEAADKSLTTIRNAPGNTLNPHEIRLVLFSPGCRDYRTGGALRRRVFPGLLRRLRLCNPYGPRQCLPNRSR